MLPPFMEERAQACGAGPVESACGVKRYWGDTPFWEKPIGEWTFSEPTHVVDAAVLVDDEPEQCVDEYVFVGIWDPTLRREMSGLFQEGAPQNIDEVDDDFLCEACKTTLLLPKSMGASGTAVSLAISKKFCSRVW